MGEIATAQWLKRSNASLRGVLVSAGLKDLGRICRLLIGLDFKGLGEINVAFSLDDSRHGGHRQMFCSLLKEEISLERLTIEDAQAASAFSLENVLSPF